VVDVAGAEVLEVGAAVTDMASMEKRDSVVEMKRVVCII